MSEAIEKDPRLGLKRFALGFILFGSILSGITFVWKLYTFFHDWTSNAGIGFAGPHLVSYSLVAAGFILFLLVAFLQGHFSQIEKPKNDMLEQEMEYDRQGNIC